MSDRTLASFFDAVRLPLADLLRATADWLDDEADEFGEQAEEVADADKPKWVPNDRGGFDPA